jgi:hypothetical protein
MSMFDLASSQRKFIREEANLIGNLGCFLTKWSVRKVDAPSHDLCQAFFESELGVPSQKFIALLDCMVPPPWEGGLPGRNQFALELLERNLSPHSLPGQTQKM